MKSELVNKSLSIIAKWGKATGILFIIMGALAALSGAFFFIIGAAPGVLQIIAGVFLLRSAKEAAKMLEQLDDNAEEIMLENYAKFVKMQGIYLIVSIVLSILVMVAVFVFMMLGVADGLFNEYDYQYYE
ncbi:DUF5362 family protein [Bacillus atrophaeus]